MAYRSSDPFTGGTHASLVARGTEVAGFAGEGEQPLIKLKETEIIKIFLL